MQMASSTVMPDRENGTGRLQESRAAVGGKLRGSNASLANDNLSFFTRLIFAVVTLFVATISGSVSYAQSGPFAGRAVPAST
jgi:hypothetical protein